MAATVARPMVSAPMTTAQPGRVRSGRARRHGQGGVDRTRRRFDHDGSLVAEAGGHLVQLQVVGDESQRPTASGVGAEAGLQARLGGDQPTSRSQ